MQCTTLSVEISIAQLPECQWVYSCLAPRPFILLRLMRIRSRGAYMVVVLTYYTKTNVVTKRSLGKRRTDTRVLFSFSVCSFCFVLFCFCLGFIRAIIKFRNDSATFISKLD